jgi:hypothetical protein
MGNSVGRAAKRRARGEEYQRFAMLVCPRDDRNGAMARGKMGPEIWTERRAQPIYAVL